MAIDLHSYLITLIAAAQGAPGDEGLTQVLEHLLATASAPQAELLRRAAIPRWIDAAVLSVLQEPEEPGEDQLAALRAYSFVRELGDGRLALPDTLRAALLATWRRDRPEALHAIQLRLYHHFSQQTTPPGTAGGAMPLLPDSPVLSVVPASTEADLRRRAAIYHLLHLDPEHGLDQLRASFAHLEATRRCAEAERLLATAAEAVGEAALGPRQRRWLQYLRARLLHATQCRAEAAAQLTALQAHGDLEPDLAGHVSRSLGLIYAEQGHGVQAIELYRQSIAHFARTGEQQALAETLLLLGAAYQELAARAGEWYTPVAPQSLLLQASAALGSWLLALPFLIASLVLGPGNRLLPVPEHCAHYQNWLRIRLANVARSWYAQARDAFQLLGDATGVLRAEQHLADLVLHYGYPAEARATLEELLRQPAARDPYLRAWLQRSLAACELASGQYDRARALLSELQAFFAELGDTRRVATVLALRGRAALRAGDGKQALDDLSAALGQFRTLQDTAAREQILDELRAWQQRPGTSAGTRLRIDALLAAEPEQRYVERFIHSYRDLLRGATALALPLALLLMAMVAPVPVITPQPNGVISFGASFDPWRATGVVATLLLIAMAGYAAIATAIIAWLPIGRIEREQPDAIVTRPGSIARYDGRGQLVTDLPWATVRRWLSLDRCLWKRPLALHSRMVLEGAPGQALAIAGLTGWYSQLQQDIERRLALAGGPPVVRRQLGTSLLRSPGGILIALGVALLLLVAATTNGWLQLSPAFAPPLAAAIWFLALSGSLILAPIAVWLAARPGILGATQPGWRWPLLTGALGGGTVMLAVLAGGGLIRVEALRYALILWGAAVLADALVATLLPRRRLLRLGAVAAAVALSLVWIGRPALAHYHWLEGSLARAQVQNGATAAVLHCAAAATARELGASAYATLLVQADCAGHAGDWTAAARYYLWAVQAAPEGSSRRALAHYNLAVAAGYLGDPSTLIQASGAYQQICARRAWADPICAQLQAAGPPQLRR